MVTEEGRLVLLKNIFECGDLSHNILPVKRLQENNLTVVFKSNKVAIMKNSVMITSGRTVGNLYVLNFTLQNIGVYVADSNDQNLWHRSMGHSSKYPSREICETCIKASKYSYPINR